MNPEFIYNPIVFLAGPQGLDIIPSRALGVDDNLIYAVEGDRKKYQKLRSVPYLGKCHILNEDVWLTTIRLHKNGTQPSLLYLDYCGMWRHENASTTRGASKHLSEGSILVITVLRARDNQIKETDFVNVIANDLRKHGIRLSPYQSIFYQSRRANGNGSSMITMAFVIGEYATIKMDCIDLRWMRSDYYELMIKNRCLNQGIDCNKISMLLAKER